MEGVRRATGSPGIVIVRSVGMRGRWLVDVAFPTILLFAVCWCCHWGVAWEGAGCCDNDGGVVKRRGKLVTYASMQALSVQV